MASFNPTVSFQCDSVVAVLIMAHKITGGYIASVFFLLIIGTFGYTSFMPFSTKSFFSCYAMALLSILFFVGWSVVKRNGFKDPLTIDLVWKRPDVDHYEATTLDVETTFWAEMAQLFLIRRKETTQGQSMP